MLLKHVLMDIIQLLFKIKMFHVLNVQDLTLWLIVIMLVMLQAVMQDIVQLMEIVQYVQLIQLHVTEILSFNVYQDSMLQTNI